MEKTNDPLSGIDLFAPHKGPKVAGETQVPSNGVIGETRFFQGYVRDYYARSDIYLVLDPGMNMTVECRALHPYGYSGLQMGARSVSGGYPPKTAVLVLQAAGINIILGMTPAASIDLKTMKPDYLVMRSQVGSCDPNVAMHLDPLKQERGLSYYDVGRPEDALCGDWGGINELGVAVFVGKIIASLRASDLAKVEAFWGDDILRFVGYNLQTYTGVREEYEVTDEGEGNQVRRTTPFFWEGIGAKEALQEAVKQIGQGSGRAGRALDPDGNAWWEAKNKDQMVIPRHTLMRGYMGDLEHEWIHVPGKNMPDYETFANKTKYVGVLEIAKNTTGAYLLRSAKEISFEKSILIPVPKELKAPDDSTGDHRKNYHAAGHPALGEGGSLPEVPDYKYPEMKDANGWFDYLYEVQSWMYNRIVIGGLYLHTDKFGGKDWYFPEENDILSEFQTAPETASIDPQLLAIGNKQMVTLPKEAKLKVDHRSGHESVRYYQSRSVFKMQEDGSILIEDGYGSAIQMKGGSIFLTCVGDVVTQPGRNIINWAPRDFIAKAGNCVDLTASKKDVHIKAEKNIEMLSGNDESGVGAIVMDCRSIGKPKKSEFDQIGEDRETSGVIIKAGNSPVYIYGDDCYMGLSKDTGRITLNAKEAGQVYFRGKEVKSRIQEFNVIGRDNAELLRLFGQTAYLNAYETYVNGAAYFKGPTMLGDYSEVHGPLIVKGAVFAKDHFASLVGGPVGKATAINPVLPTPSKVEDMVDVQYKEVEARTKVDEQEVVKDTNAPGNSEFQERIHFSCRKTSQYFGNQEGTFFMWETRWQNLLKKGGGNTTWDEPLVPRLGGGDPEMPHPGRVAWQEQKKFKYVEKFINFESGTGIAKERTAVDNNGQAPQEQELSGGYVINTQE